MFLYLIITMIVSSVVNSSLPVSHFVMENSTNNAMHHYLYLVCVKLVCCLEEMALPFSF